MNTLSRVIDKELDFVLPATFDEQNAALRY